MTDHATFDFDAVNKLTRSIVTPIGRVTELGAALVRKTTLDIEADAKLFCPVDTGFLRASIGHDFFGDGRSLSMSAEIGPTANYGGYVELGTSRMAPYAYLGPAFDRRLPDFDAGVDMLAEHVLDG